MLDGAVGVFCAVGGVEPQSETVWRQADHYRVPRLAFVNKMDRIGAEFERVLGEIHEKLGHNPVAIQIPMGAENAFVGVIDLVAGQAIYWPDGDFGNTIKYDVIPDEYKDKYIKYKEILIEKISEWDDVLMDKYLAGTPISPDEIWAGLRKACLGLKIIPVLCGSAFKNKGIQTLLDAVVKLLPSPVDLPPVVGHDPQHLEKELTRLPSSKEKLAGLVFKIASDPFSGQLAFLRLYSGSLKVGDKVENSAKGKVEKIAKLYQMHANKRQEITEVVAGDIAAIVGLKFTTTGDTLCDREAQILLEKIDFPDPVLDIVIEPKTKADEEKIQESLQKLALEDPSFRIRIDEESGQTLISGMGELHLEIIVDRLLREFKVQANVGKPQVAYRETISQIAEYEMTYDKDLSGKKLFAKIKLRLTPLASGQGFEFVNHAQGEKITPNILVACETGLRESLQNGVFAGYPCLDLRAEILALEVREEESNELAFKIASSLAFREACLKAHPVLLQPIMQTEVVVPEEFMGEVVGDLNSKKAKIQKIEPRGNLQVIQAHVPLAEMFGYTTALRSLSQGRATHTLQFYKYEALSVADSQKTIAKIRGF